MITALDSCILLDVLLDDPVHGRRSIAAIQQARGEGRLIVCELVVVEIAPVLRGRIEEFLDSLQINFVPCDLPSSIHAAEAFDTYLRRGGKRGRIVPDFLIASHAIQFSDRFLTRDEGFARDYFSELVSWYPEVA
ncbi:MAG: PIN domain-containing protein [Verrucomicrobiota bacterium]